LQRTYLLSKPIIKKYHQTKAILPAMSNPFPLGFTGAQPRAEEWTQMNSLL
jgi:hypothetical protein